MLHLIIPELLGESYQELPPTLRALLARGRADPAPAPDLPQALCRVWQIDDCPIAALSLLDDGGQADGAYWLRADPVYLHLNIDQLVLTDPRDLGLSLTEAETLAASLNGHFQPDGLEFLPLAPDRWYLKLDRAPAIKTTPLPQAIGQGIHPHLPQGADASHWRSLFNEAQMLLHEHPVNQAREAQGLPPINSVWFWGGGRLDGIAKPPIDGVHANAPSVRALALAAGLTCRDEPAGLAMLDRPGPAAVVLTGSSTADREALLEHYESRWFAPALKALKSGRLDGLTLIGTGTRPVQVTVSRWAAWQFWRG